MRLPLPAARITKFTLVIMKFLVVRVIYTFKVLGIEPQLKTIMRLAIKPQ